MSMRGGVIKVKSRHVADATGGHVGVETRLPIVYTEGVSKRGLSLERWVAVTSSNAVKILGLYPRKGAIAAGSDADIVVFDPAVRRTLRSADLHGSDYSAWDGWEVHGWPSIVMLRGQVAVDNGKLVRPGGRRPPCARQARRRHPARSRGLSAGSRALARAPARGRRRDPVPRRMRCRPSA
jgi:amidohydrolase family protein